ncbi:hypothetical protein BD324DRAFT_648515 [Kockovaella imperatae]|uniref:Uncharacterized protein n=1 Tax=Kockovaella imperatae TaxID=4999 RepID=A0A1Y1URW6_9TREE|nr:hypothetical protein BD324DRAFT_648515 [Kockovaella imperatae]ORX39895.1 hypothetical protein BD324DRAFT_648515 [Kockovaella imperatae]
MTLLSSPQATLLDPDDAYRSTVLAGLSPATVLDIAAHAMSFWTYQTNQETAYQALLNKKKDAKLAAMDETLRKGGT